MSNQAEMNLLVFMDGWTRGSANKTPNKTDPIYLRGYAKGAEDRITAAEVERSKLGLPPAGPATMQMTVAHLPPELTEAIEEARQKTESIAVAPQGTPKNGTSSSIWSALHTGQLHHAEVVPNPNPPVLPSPPPHLPRAETNRFALPPQSNEEEESMLSEFNAIRNGYLNR